MLTRYLLKEILANFWRVSLLALFLLFVTKILDVGAKALEAGATFRDLAFLSFYLALFLLPFSLPLAALISTLLTFMRLAQDQELLAFKALGVAGGRLLRPVLYFSGGVFLTVALLNLWILPWSKRAMRDTLFELFERRLQRGLPEKTPVDWFPGLVLYAQKVKKKFKVKHLYLLDRRPESGKSGFICAEKGEIRLNPGEVQIYLEKGEGHFWSLDLKEAENFYFGTYLYRVPFLRPTKRELKRGEMDLEMVWARAHDPDLPGPKRRKYLSEFYQRLFYPLSALLLPLLGLPLGARLKASGKGLALVAGLGAYLAYYLLFSLGISLSESGRLPPGWGIFLPNLIFGLGVIGALRDFYRKA